MYTINKTKHCELDELKIRQDEELLKLEHIRTLISIFKKNTDKNSDMMVTSKKSLWDENVHNFMIINSYDRDENKNAEIKIPNDLFGFISNNYISMLHTIEKIVEGRICVLSEQYDKELRRSS